MQDCKVNILGTEYDITMDCDDEDRDGDTNFYSRIIRIRPFEKLLDKEATDTERKIRERHVARHELFHSFLWESGETELAYETPCRLACGNDSENLQGISRIGYCLNIL